MRLIDGFFLALIAGSLAGANILPIKSARVWKWENFWLVCIVVSLLIVPDILAFALCPNLWRVYTSLPVRELIRPFVYGFFWGFAQLGAGLCIHRLGFAMTGSLLNGIGTAVGTLAPLILQHSAMMLHPSGMLILGGTGITVIGVALCGGVGLQREQLTKEQGRRVGFESDQSAMSQADPTSKGYMLMVVVAVVAGLLSALPNVALAYSGDLLAKVREAGAAPQWAPFALWPIAFLGGSVVNLIYSFVLLTRNKSWGNFAGAPREIVYPVLAASMWMGGIALYSSATTYFGILGVSIGFAMFTTIQILAAQSTAIFTGEWRQIPPRIYGRFAAGLTILVLAVVIFGAANYFSV